LPTLRTDFARLEESADPLAPLKSELQRFVKREAGGERASAIEILAEAARNPATERIVRRAYRTDEATPGRIAFAGRKKGTVDPALDPDQAAGMLISLFYAVKILLSSAINPWIYEGRSIPTPIHKAFAERLAALEAQKELVFSTDFADIE